MRRPALLAAALAVMALALGRPVPAATITVDGATCTLADAIRSANADAAPGGSGCADGSGDDVIVLDADVVLTTADAAVSGSTNTGGGIAGLPDVTGSVDTLAIQAGLGDTIERDPSYGCAAQDPDAFRLLNVGSFANLTLDGLTLRNGCVAPAAPTTGVGGAVHVGFSASLTVIHGTFIGSRVRGGGGTGGIAGGEARGGAVGGSVGDYTVTLSDTLLRDNGVQGGASDDDPGDAGGGAVYVSNGPLTVLDCELRDNVAQGGDYTGAGGCGFCFGGHARGGALIVSSPTASAATVDLRDSTFAGNAARGGGGGAAANGGTTRGGGIYLFGASGTLERLLVTGNLARGGGGDFGGAAGMGGGLFTEGLAGPVIRDSVFANNTARGGESPGGDAGLGHGGGAKLEAAGGEVSGCTFTGNLAQGGDAAGSFSARAGIGGGVFLLGASPLPAFTNSTISGNVARGGAQTGSGVGGEGQGGGIAAAKELPAVSHLTVTGNEAVGGAGAGGGGAALGGGMYVLLAGTVVTLDNSLLADNSVTPGGGVPAPEDCFLAGGTLTSDGYNLVETPDASCSFTSIGDQTGVDPQLLPLADNGCVVPLPNGGCVPTVAIPAASAAADAGSCAVSGLAADQRGVARPQDLPAVPDAADGCDVGAYEATPPPPAFIFGDGFESGDTSAWSAQSPP